MKKLYLLALFLFSCKLVFGQEVEAINLGERDQSITALNRNYYGAAVHIQRMDHGSVWSVTPEYGRIINNYISMGVNGKLMWYNTSDPGMVFIQISFWGYQWTQTDGVRTSSWKFFRHDANDIAVGFCFYI